MSDALWTITVKGPLNKPGSYQATASDTLLDVIFREAGGMKNDRLALKAVLIGGSQGKFAAEAELKAVVNASNDVMVMDEGSCIVNIVSTLLTYNLMCLPRQTGCVICRQALAEAVELLAKLRSPQGGIASLSGLKSLVAETGAKCRDGCRLLNPLTSALMLYEQEFASHAAGRCPASICGELMLSPCSNSCPANVDLPGTIALMQMGKFQEALTLGRQDNPLFLTCGYVCEDPPCQNNCKRLSFDEAVYSQSLHRYAGEKAARQAGSLAKALRHPSIAPGKPTGKKVAIIGGGPAGLSAAYFLARLGHKAVIYEKASNAGGMAAFGIPAYRMDRAVLAEEIAAIQSLGVEFIFGCEVGRDIAADELRRQYDAVLIAVGASLSRKLGIPGENLPGVAGAIEFLAAAAQGRAQAHSNRVLVIGGGNVAIDAARTARRLGVMSVRLMCVEDIFEMPASRQEIVAAQHEGIDIIPLSAPLAFSGGERVEKTIYAKVKPGPYDAVGRRWPPQLLTEQKVETECDLVIVAIGQMPDVSGLAKVAERRGTFLEADARHGLFVAGDCCGPVNTVVKAVKSGKEAAFAIDQYLMGKSTPLTGEIRQHIGCFSGPLVCHTAPRVGMPEQDAKIRTRNFDLVELGLTDEQAKYEMLRCICAAKGAL
ncbi:MAG: FAD-dependent oxidoreductase [Negativicutes bacterium]|nr:FAD-dependent oxidoreductase [Negativicutes bacterium]